MTTEFKLDEKILTTSSVLNLPNIEVKDVKEFIRLLKEASKFGKVNHIPMMIDVEELEQIIDILAGPKLADQQTKGEKER